jgi:hypothetical protein
MVGFATLAAGVLAAIGAVGVVIAAVSKDGSPRRLSFKVGAYGLALGGVVLMLGGLAGWFRPTDAFGGLLMVVFATGSNVLPAQKAGSASSD